MNSAKNFLNGFKLILEFIRIRQSGLFDREYYLRSYPDVQQFGQNPIMHFLKIGWKEGKNPSPRFETRFYLREYKDVRKANLNPLVHFIRWGRKEGRLPVAPEQVVYPRYPLWVKIYDTLSIRDKMSIKSKIKSLAHTPQITLILPITLISNRILWDTIRSLRKQLYRHWNLVILINQSEILNLSKIVMWLIRQDRRVTLLPMTADVTLPNILQKKIEDSPDGFIGIIKPTYTLSPHALYLMVEWINRFPNANILYSDDDKINNRGNRFNPYFKPDWNPDLFLTQNYLSGFTLIRAETVIKTVGNQTIDIEMAFWDLLLGASEIIDALTIQHLPFVLSHKHTDQMPNFDSENESINKKIYQEMLTAHFDRIGTNAQVNFQDKGPPRITYLLPESDPLVSIIIPTRDNIQLLSKCIKGIPESSTYPNKEIIIIDNQSQDPETYNYFSQLRSERYDIRIIKYDQPFNFSAINNFAVQKTSGSILIFLNNDIEPLTPDWISEMAGHAIRPEVGAVGAMLYYPDDTIQHAGIILRPNSVAFHAYLKNARGFKGQHNRLTQTQNLSAVTAACMAVEKKKFINVGGFDAINLPIAYNDLDLCLCLLDAGYRNVWTPHAEFYHHESATRGYEDTPKKKARFDQEAHFMIKKWGQKLQHDPAYNPNLSLDTAHFELAFPPRVVKPWLDQRD